MLAFPVDPGGRTVLAGRPVVLIRAPVYDKVY